MTFNKWFEAQFGKRPSKKETYDLRREYRDLEDLSEAAKRLYESTCAWDNRHHSALSAYITFKKAR